MMWHAAVSTRLVSASSPLSQTLLNLTQKAAVLEAEKQALLGQLMVGAGAARRAGAAWGADCKDDNCAFLITCGQPSQQLLPSRFAWTAPVSLA